MVKDVSEINIYFPNYADMQLPERDYLIAVINTINPDTTKQIISKARENRSILIIDEPQNLVKITSEIRNEICSTNPHKSKKISIVFRISYLTTLFYYFSNERDSKLFIEG